MTEIEIDRQNSIDFYDSFPTRIEKLLSYSQLLEVDDILLALVTKKPRKVAYIIGQALNYINHDMFKENQFNIDVLLAQRIFYLVEIEQIKAQGDVRAIRFSEVHI